MGDYAMRMREMKTYESEDWSFELEAKTLVGGFCSAHSPTAAAVVRFFLNKSGVGSGWKEEKGQMVNTWDMQGVNGQPAFFIRFHQVKKLYQKPFRNYEKPPTSGLAFLDFFQVSVLL